MPAGTGTKGGNKGVNVTKGGGTVTKGSGTVTKGGTMGGTGTKGGDTVTKGGMGTVTRAAMGTMGTGAAKDAKVHAVNAKQAENKMVAFTVTMGGTGTMGGYKGGMGDMGMGDMGDKGGMGTMGDKGGIGTMGGTMRARRRLMPPAPHLLEQSGGDLLGSPSLYYTFGSAGFRF